MVKIRLDPLLKAEGPEPFSFAIIPLSETFFLVRRHIILDVLLNRHLILLLTITFYFGKWFHTDGYKKQTVNKKKNNKNG
jgi:hypothetical protein